MIIKQDDLSPVQDLYDKNKLSIAFNEINKISGDLVVDTEELKTFCEETVKLLKKFETDIEALEKKTEKNSNIKKFQEKLYGHDPLG